METVFYLAVHHWDDSMYSISWRFLFLEPFLDEDSVEEDVAMPGCKSTALLCGRLF